MARTLFLCDECMCNVGRGEGQYPGLSLPDGIAPFFILFLFPLAQQGAGPYQR